MPHCTYIEGYCRAKRARRRLWLMLTPQVLIFILSAYGLILSFRGSVAKEPPTIRWEIMPPAPERYRDSSPLLRPA